MVAISTHFIIGYTLINLLILDLYEKMDSPYISQGKLGYPRVPRGTYFYIDPTSSTGSPLPWEGQGAKSREAKEKTLQGLAMDR